MESSLLGSMDQRKELRGLYSRTKDKFFQVLNIEQVPVDLINRMKILAKQRKMSLKELVIEILSREVNK